MGLWNRLIVLIAVLAAGGAVWAQSGGLWVPRDHEAIRYSTREPHNAIVRLNERIRKGELQLDFEELPRGYLASVLKALDIPVSSQALVFSENSLQGPHIRMATPRAIYFNDDVAIGWAKGADTIEAVAVDAAQGGVHFYSVVQSAQQKPQFVRRDRECLQCHLLPETSGVPGLLAMSVLPLSDNPNEYAQGWSMDHRTPIEDRWGGWYVTGEQVPARHLGNVPVLHVPHSYVRAEVAPRLASGTEAFDASAYPSPHSDIVALMVLNHQLHMTNLITRLGWQARIAAAESPASGALPPYVRETAYELVDYMVFADEAPLPSPIKGATSFAQEFAAKGPRDSKGRSLRDFDLRRRLFRYPCSYMIYTEAFDGLPQLVKHLIYQRLWDVLSGGAGEGYENLSAADRRAVIEIVRETKPDLPSAFKSAYSPTSSAQ